MKEQFVTYEIALALKEVGFSKPCLAVFPDSKNNKENIMLLGGIQKFNFNYSLSAPLWQQAIDWLRENHKLNVIIDNKYEHQIDKWVGITQNTNIYYDEYVTSKFDSYYEAREQAVLKAIKLIKTV